MRVLVVDNYDSFVYNLAQCVGSHTQDVIVKRNDQVSLEDVRKLAPDRIIISPGPGNPSDPRYFGISLDIIRQLSRTTPTLGVCLGHQGIVHAFGGKIIHAKKLRHGKTSPIRHDGKGIFDQVKNPFSATRYHSLIAEEKSLPGELEVTARSLDDHEIMGVRHRKFPIEGVQFHPESILTTVGQNIISNFLRRTEN
ncbi:MAG TPA: aminodeoxychorismate/anthranilate synthase component II [Candidatus Bathyarchaeia archaeon]|nr:aminodeoxychorismate/anthranilate synthase component II [Candidatus Bathyarchaeia archaeon]